MNTDMYGKMYGKHKSKTWHSLKIHWQLYLLLLAPMAAIFVFKYLPMYGIQIAFKAYNFRQGITRSPWIGFRHFEMFFRSFQFPRLLGNTIGVSLYDIAAGFLPPIILAIALNECKNIRFKKIVQLVTYAPYFVLFI